MGNCLLYYSRRYSRREGRDRSRECETERGAKQSWKFHQVFVAVGERAAFHSFSSLANELNKLYTCWRFQGIKYRKMDRRRKEKGLSFALSLSYFLLNFFLLLRLLLHTHTHTSARTYISYHHYHHHHNHYDLDDEVFLIAIHLSTCSLSLLYFFGYYYYCCCYLTTWLNLIFVEWVVVVRCNWCVWMCACVSTRKHMRIDFLSFLYYYLSSSSSK